MKYQVLFSLKNNKKVMTSAVVVIGALRVNSNCLGWCLKELVFFMKGQKFDPNLSSSACQRYCHFHV